MDIDCSTTNIQKQRIWRYLSTRGIHNEDEFERAIRKMNSIDIGLMVINKEKLAVQRRA
jgi:hypothetical protein